MDVVSGQALAATRRQIRHTPAIASATLRAWIKGPTCAERKAGFVSSVPPGTRLLGLSISDGTAVIDMNARFERTGWGVIYEGALLEQLAWTITQFPSVDRALLTIGGEEKEGYMGHGFVIDEENPLARN